MPLYEYACRDCGNHFDVRQGIREEPLSICPTCGGSVRRVIQPVGIVFKGSGFYKTDSRSASEASVPSGQRAAESTPAASSDGTGAAPKASESPAPPKPAAAQGSSASA